jgi:hypothetical protein
MDRPRFAHRQRSIAVLVVCALLASCISVPTGTTQIYRKDDSGATPPVTFAKTLFRNKTNPAATVTKSGTDKAGADVFAIYLSDGYFKYLKDMGGVNEVVVVAEFTETNAGAESDTVTRVLGPYFGVADKAGTPFLNKLLYGPKTLDSDHLNMKLTVLEYDQGENENTAAFLDFIQSVTQTLSLANPVTASEQAFAKEIAKSLLSLNKDDVVMEIDVNFTGNAGELASVDDNGSYIPLNKGDYVLINREHCVPANCYMQLTDEGTTWNPFAWIGDIALLVPTGMRRAWTDTPDHDALEGIDSSNLKFDEHQLTKVGPNRVAEPFTDKTWLALSVVKGGDASLWQKRKLLTQAEKSIQDMIKVRGGPIAFSQNYQTAKQALEDARQAELLSSSGVTFVSPLDANGAFTPTSTTPEYCLYHSRSLAMLSANFYHLVSGVPQQLPSSAIQINAAKKTPNNTCLTVTPGALGVGKYEMIATYSVGNKSDVLPQKISFAIEK